MQDSTASGSWPILVHCQAGAGRTGLFIMTDFLKTQLECNQVSPILNYKYFYKIKLLNLVQTQYLEVSRISNHCFLRWMQELDLPGSLLHLRMQRMLAVQTVVQYRFIHSVVVNYLKQTRLANGRLIWWLVILTLSNWLVNIILITCPCKIALYIVVDDCKKRWKYDSSFKLLKLLMLSNRIIKLFIMVPYLKHLICVTWKHVWYFIFKFILQKYQSDFCTQHQNGQKTCLGWTFCRLLTALYLGFKNCIHREWHLAFKRMMECSMAMQKRSQLNIMLAAFLNESCSLLW
jgi:hypothetical protein